MSGAVRCRNQVNRKRPAQERPTEHQEQSALIQWAFDLEPQAWELGLLFAIPNGGYRAKSTAVKLKNEGVKPGVPDLFLPVPMGGWSGLFIEMKTIGGRASPEQKAWLSALKRQSYSTVVAKGWVEAAHAIANYLGRPDLVEGIE